MRLLRLAIVTSGIPGIPWGAVGPVFRAAGSRAGGERGGAVPVRVVVTRPREQAGELARRLERLGHEVALCPLIAIETTGSHEIDASGYDWLVVTSVNGARELGRRLRGRSRFVAAIGAGTAAELTAEGLEPDLVPEVSTQEGLLHELPRPAGRVLLAAAEEARRLLVEELRADFVPLYRTRELHPERFPEADLVLLASPSAARAYAALRRPMPTVSIGPQTTAAARAAGIRVLVEASTHDLDGLVRAVGAAASDLRDPERSHAK
jgi:uroporphyrinogen III methyltransferase / synthase